MNREELMQAAREAALHAYAPYSKFRVGAAVVVESADGPRIVAGANVENASYGLALCAERAALANTMKYTTPGAKPVITHVAVACIDASKEMGEHGRTPCGACRQWLAELAPNATYYVDGIDRDLTLDDLLPLAFRLDL